MRLGLRRAIRVSVRLLVIIAILETPAAGQSTFYSDTWDGEFGAGDFFPLYGAGVTETSYTSGEIVWTVVTMYDGTGAPVAETTSEYSYTFARADALNFLHHDIIQGRPPANCAQTCHWRMNEATGHSWCELGTEAQAFIYPFDGRYYYVGQGGSGYEYYADNCAHECQRGVVYRSQYSQPYLHDPGYEFHAVLFGVCRHNYKPGTVRGRCTPPH